MTKKFKPVTKMLEKGQVYYFWNLTDTAFYSKSVWCHGYLESLWLKLHKIYLNKNHAKRAGEFVKKFIKENSEQLKYVISTPEQGTELWYGKNMDGSTSDQISINFDLYNISHQYLLDTRRLYKSKADVIAAGKLIVKALKAERKRQKYKYLTEEPEPRTELYYPTIANPHNPCSVNSIYYDPREYSHVILLKQRLLFLTRKDAEIAGLAMRQYLNPLAPKLSYEK